MVVTPRQLKCATRPRAAVEMPQLPTSQAWLAASTATFLAAPGVEKNPPEQDVPQGSPVTSRWKVGPLLMEMALTDLQSSRVFCTPQAGLRVGSSPGSSYGILLPFFIKS